MLPKMEYTYAKRGKGMSDERSNIYCRKCGTKTYDDSLFCSNCGDKLIIDKITNDIVKDIKEPINLKKKIGFRNIKIFTSIFVAIVLISGYFIFQKIGKTNLNKLLLQDWSRVEKKVVLIINLS